jgi:sugar phosphate isomerase/epimerase
VRVRLGITTTFAIKRWPMPADWAPIVRDRLGLCLVQHTLDLVEPPLGTGTVVARSGAVRKATAEHGLEIHSTITGRAASVRCLMLHPDREARTEARLLLHRAITFTERVGGVATGGHLGALSSADAHDPDRRRERFAELRAALVTLATDARRAGLEYLVVENRPSAREVSDMATLRELLRDGDELHVPIRACLDLGHMCVAGAGGEERDPYAWLRAFAPVAPVVQVQQCDADADRHWPFTSSWNAVGRIHADAVLDALGEGGAQDVVLMLEVSPPSAQADEGVVDDLLASVGYWREALARRGLGEG